SSSKQLGPAVSDGEAPRQSPEGTAALTQPLSQRPASPDSNGGLCPTPERKKDSEGRMSCDPLHCHQSTISRCSDNVAEGSESKVEKPLENFVRDSSSTSDNSSIRPGDGEETSMPPRKRSRLSRGPSDSDRSSGQEVEPLLGRPPEQNVDDGTVKPKVQVVEAAYVRAVMAAIVLFAGGVCDIQELVGCLQRPTSPMSLMDINEMLYCTATLLYAMRENGVKISNRTDLKSTREQEQILNHAFKKPGEVVKIVGFAGTGKTYTLIQYTKKWPKLKFLYLAFNSSVREQAKQLFPENVTCETFHSLAKEAIKTDFLQSNRQEKLPFIRVSMIVQTLTAFFASADDSITIIVEDAKEIWREMQTLSPTGEMAHRMTHEAMADIIRSQKCSVILVGDPHQKIYSFRGADNTVFNIPHNHIFYLTQSFRFGSEIAYVGATILDVSKGVRKKTLVGNKQESDVSGVGVEGTVAHLSRTNKTVFEDAVKLTCGDTPAKIHLLGGLEAFDKIRDIWVLRHPEQTEDEELKTIIAIVKETQGSIPDLLDKISQHHVSAPEDAGTVHNAKGQEFDTVQVARDFANITLGWYSKKVPGIEASE
ncbi:hypothetical protein Chor_008196, partial [Crotalus horridus]